MSFFSNTSRVRMILRCSWLMSLLFSCRMSVRFLRMDSASKPIRWAYSLNVESGKNNHRIADRATGLRFFRALLS